MFAQESVMEIQEENNLIQEAFEVEADEVGFCLDQKWSDYENPYENSDTALAFNLFKKGWLAKARAVPEWISVEDGLPSDGQNIIAFDAIKHYVFKDGEFLQGYFEPDTGHEYTEPVDVTHWIAIEAQEQKV